MTQAIELHPNLKKWERSNNYMGENWSGWYMLLSQTRDSEPLERSNFAVARDIMRQFDEQEVPGSDIGECSVQVASFGHWGCGWMECIMIHESNAAALEKASELLERLDDYPVLNEEHFSQLEYEQACETWKGLLLSDRVELCQKFDISVFAARHEELSKVNDIDGSLYEWLITP